MLKVRDHRPALEAHDLEAMRSLWCAVLYEQLRLATKARPSSKYVKGHIRDAQLWIGSRGFREVCELAGFDADWIEAGARALLDRADAMGNRPRARSRGFRSVASSLMPEGEA